MRLQEYRSHEQLYYTYFDDSYYKYQEKLDKLRDKLGSPAGLCTLHGGFANDDSNVVEKIKYEFGKIDGVIAHGGLIRSDTLGTGVVGKSILKVSPEEVVEDTRILLRLHLTAAQALIPMLESKIGTESWESYLTYTFLTGELRAKETSLQALRQQKLAKSFTARAKQNCFMVTRSQQEQN